MRWSSKWSSRLRGSVQMLDLQDCISSGLDQQRIYILLKEVLQGRPGSKLDCN